MWAPPLFPSCCPVDLVDWSWLVFGWSPVWMSLRIQSTQTEECRVF
jgi:hypothetical protein